MEQPEDMPSRRALQCGRRMFLAALILASKYLQDHNYSARAWSKISGLKVCEINCNEMAFLTAVNWRLHFPEALFERWQDVVMHYCQQPPSPGSSLAATWKSVIPRLTPALDTVDVAPRTPVAKVVAGPAPQPTNMYTVPDDTNACFKIARYLEPKAEPLPPTPALTRMGPLPTPQLTPQAPVACTPAARTATCGPRQSSMCSAMAQVNRTALSRSVTDSWTPRASDLEQYRISSGRRPSVAISTTSSSSSPESMVSDISSRTSRSSSISSASSGYSMGATTTTTPVKLCRLATLRNAGLPYSMPLKEAIPESVSSEPMSSPDFESLSFRDVSPSEYLPLRKVRTEPTSNSATKGRKRGRSSVDIHLQQNVRNLLRTDSYSSMPSVITDTDVANSFLLDSTTSSRCATPRSNADRKALQSPARSVSERRLPVQKELGRKRACCASEARGGIMRFEGGPGMWDGVL
ncbi:hypothetical protein LTS18_013349 [Coniosporium uncinatum]|uniref:Uncharacterized protein n=1 Tax=Coniosporium uncinatum TaxID=93489 RepID=A0ACC3DI24_9PEZI|nr:hypothetical protein LTS18_013349 [Coniosporium uncinatum]